MTHTPVYPVVARRPAVQASLLSGWKRLSVGHNQHLSSPFNFTQRLQLRADVVAHRHKGIDDGGNLLFNSQAGQVKPKERSHTTQTLFPLRMVTQADSQASPITTLLLDPSPEGIALLEGSDNPPLLDVPPVQPEQNGFGIIGRGAAILRTGDVEGGMVHISVSW